MWLDERREIQSNKSNKMKQVEVFWQGLKSGWASSNVVGIICPLVRIGLTKLPNSWWAKAHLAAFLWSFFQPSSQVDLYYDVVPHYFSLYFCFQDT